MITTLKQNRTWGINTDLKTLTVNERRDALVLLMFLNAYGEPTKAFDEIKKQWVSNIYELPNTSAPSYGTVKTGRYNILSRMKRIYKDYMVQLQSKE